MNTNSVAMANPIYMEAKLWDNSLNPSLHFDPIMNNRDDGATIGDNLSVSLDRQDDNLYSSIHWH